MTRLSKRTSLMLLQVLKKLYQNGIVVVSIIANKEIQILRDCEFSYVDLMDDPCNLYTGDTGTGSL